MICDDSNDGKLVSLILDPGTELREEKPGEARSGVDVEPRSRIGQIELPKYSSIVLFNPSELTADEADRLSAWVNNGGGLVIILGPAAVGPGAVGGAGLPNAPPVPVGSTLLERSAQGGLASLLPGKVRGITQIPLDGDLVVIRPKAEGHPIWNIFERPASEIPWVNYPVRQHWNLEGLDPASSVIANFTQSELPMLVETIRGSGRIIVMTVPYPEPGATAAQGAWSELFTTSSDAWPGFAFFLSTVRYLATQSKHPVNYSVGSTAILENNPKEFPRMYELRQPSGELVRVEADEEGLSYPFTQQSGHYRLRGSRARGPLVRGFSVNVAREEVSLKSIERESLAKAFGEGNLWIAKTKEEVQSSIGEGRYGRDLGPFLWVILAMMVMAEQTMSSRFYASQQRGRS